MYIYPIINSFSYCNKPKNPVNRMSNPITQDRFESSFTARLFRTPENFYAQPFNKSGMPETMKDYLNADYEDRQKMPPAQMLKLVFDDINETKDLEQVKRLYPNEQLFANLTDNPKIKSRTGILAEIDLMREDGKSLFKNGKDNLGHYILKKIYTEAKTLKEINSDFKKDISVYYKDLSPIGYETIHAFGISFPEAGFWKSLTATREEFPYEYKPRKPIESKITSPHKTKTVVAQRNRFDNIKDWEVDKLVKAVMDGNGSVVETKKRLKKTNLQDEASLNFVAKYLGEINSVVLEKLHISPEMRYFFENYDKLNKTQTQKFTEYMKQKDVNELRSVIMSDTIKLFFEAYGVDGQNEDFQELLNYARSIKPAREQALNEHNRIQAEYDKMFAQLPEPIETPQAPKSFDDIIQEESKKYDVPLYSFKLSNGVNLSFTTNLKEDVQNKLHKEFLYYPDKFINDFTRFIMKKEGNNVRYLFSLTFDPKDFGKTQEYISTEELKDGEADELLSLFQKEHLMSKKELMERNSDLLSDFIRTRKTDENAIRQALAEELYRSNYNPLRDINFGENNDQILRDVITKMREIMSNTKNYKVYTINSKILNEIFKLITPTENFDQTKDNILKRYEFYKNPLSVQEINKLPDKITEGFLYYDKNKSGVADSEYKLVTEAISNMVKEDKEYRKLLTSILKKYFVIQPWMSDYRVYMNPQSSKEALAGKSESTLIQLLNENSFKEGTVDLFLKLDDKSLELIKDALPELYLSIKSYNSTLSKS